MHRILSESTTPSAIMPADGFVVFQTRVHMRRRIIALLIAIHSWYTLFHIHSLQLTLASLFRYLNHKLTELTAFLHVLEQTVDSVNILNALHCS